MSIVILLGAGASYGSKDVIPYLPPLGNQLFQKLVENSGIASQIDIDIKNSFLENFEIGMSKYFDAVHGNIMTFQRELAHYLACFSPGPQNIYKNLISILGSKKIIYSSLNYDLLFELSAAQLRLDIAYCSEYRPGYVRLLKIHGSSNFWPDMSKRPQLINCEFFNCGIDIDAPIMPLDQFGTIQNCKNENSLSPAIAMFAEGKKLKVSPDFVINQYEQWKKEVYDASYVFIIGVRVHEVDEHIWGVLGNTKAIINYFGFDSDKNEFESWKKNYKKKNAYFKEYDFENSISIIKEIFSRKNLW